MTELRDLLKSNVVTITFKKIDGTERVLKGTLMEDYLPERKESTIIRKGNDETTCVWDVENKGYRSFRNDSVISYNL